MIAVTVVEASDPPTHAAAPPPPLALASFHSPDADSRMAVKSGPESGSTPADLTRGDRPVLLLPTLITQTNIKLNTTATLC